MKFIGRPGGVTMKHAPSGYKHGETYKMPFGMSSRPYWELLEPVPELVAPELGSEDDVFEEAVFTPDVEDDEAFIPVVNIDPDTPASISVSLDYLKPVDMSQYTVSAPSTEEHEEAEILELSPIEGESHTAEFETLSVKVEPVEALDREALKRVLDEAGIDYKKGTRTTTLKKMVDGLAAEG